MNKEEFKTFCQQYSRTKQRNLPLIMGILNQTPDSFSDGGHYNTLSKAFDKAMQLIEDGADLLDIGGESSRPYAKPISLQEELDRVLPLIEKIASESAICLSIDTTKPIVMKEAVARGVGLINDINALQEEGAIEMASRLKVPVCLMHRQGSSETMQDKPFYSQGLIRTIKDFFHERIGACIQGNIPKEDLILDPGFGFGKTTADNLRLIKELDRFHHFDLPLMLGFSRKQSLGELLNKGVDQRLIGGLCLSILASLNGVSILRTHDVDATRQAILILNYYNQIDVSEKEEALND